MSETTTPGILLYGPDSKNGTNVIKKSFRSYIYYLVWYVDGQKVERSTKARFPDRDAAESALEAELTARRSKREDAPAGGYRAHEVKMGWILEAYWTEYAHGLTSAKSIEQGIRRMFPFWEGRLLSEVGEPSCRDFLKWRMGQLNVHSVRAVTKWERLRDEAKEAMRPFTKPCPKAKTISQGRVRTELEYLRAAIMYCRRMLHIRETAPVWLPEKSAPREAWFTRREFAKLLLAAREPIPGRPHGRRHLIVFLLAGVYHAARKTALLELPLIQPFDGGAWLNAETGKIDFGPGNGKKLRARDVEVHTRLLVYVRAAVRRGQHYLIEEERRVRVKTGEGHIVAVKRMPIKSPRVAFMNCVKRAGIEKHVMPHTLRHTGVSWLKQESVDSWDVGDYVGMSPATVDNVYGKHDPERSRKVINALTRGRRGR